MIELKQWVKDNYDIDIAESQLQVLQRIIDGKYDKESTLARMAREYAVTVAKDGNTGDIDSLAQQIRTMSVRSNLYKMLKVELKARGWWKNRPRGKPGSF